MSQMPEGMLRSFFIRCSNVGLDCGHIIFGDGEYRVMHNAIIHMYEYHAIIPEEMTTCMKLKISENIHLYRDSMQAQILDESSDVPEKILPVI